MNKRVAITLHGIRTSGKWQKDLAPILAKHDIVPYPLDYGRFNAAQLLIPRCREHKVQWLFKEYERVRTETNIKRPSIVAHSFGSYLVCELLRRFPEFVFFDKLILAGSIVRADFNWAMAIEKSQVIQVRNEVATRDRWPVVAKMCVGKAGDSGTKGFDGFPKGGRLCQTSHEIGHSGTHFDGMYNDWAKFICCTRYLSDHDRDVICQILEFAVGRTADILDINKTLLRANILLPSADGPDVVLKIPEGAHFNMTHEPELDISIPVGKGLSGIAFTERKNVGFLRTKHSWGPYGLSEKQLKKIHPDLEWVLSFPIVDKKNGKVLGVMSVDGLSPSTIPTDPSNPNSQMAMNELIINLVPMMADQLCALETGGF